MKADEIHRLIAADPGAVLAVRPPPNVTNFVRVRGIKPGASAGAWSCAEATHLFTGEWRLPEDPFVVSSRDLCSVDEALAIVKHRASVNARLAEEIRLAERASVALKDLGIKARRSKTAVLVSDVEALLDLLRQARG